MKLPSAAAPQNPLGKLHLPVVSGLEKTKIQLTRNLDLLLPFGCKVWLVRIRD